MQAAKTCSETSTPIRHSGSVRAARARKLFWKDGVDGGQADVSLACPKNKTRIECYGTCGACSSQHRGSKRDSAKITTAAVQGIGFPDAPSRGAGITSGVAWPTMPDSVSAGRRLDYSPGRRLQRHRAPILRERSIGRSRLDHRRTAWRVGSAVPADEPSDPGRRIFSLRDSRGAADTMQESTPASVVPI